MIWLCSRILCTFDRPCIIVLVLYHRDTSLSTLHFEQINVLFNFINMRLFQATHRFDHPWNQVTLANWRKYPNSMSPHILNVDVLERSVDPATG